MAEFHKFIEFLPALEQRDRIYCKQKVTVFGELDDIKELAPAGFHGHNLSISFESESRNNTCFNCEILSKQYPKLIFVITTSIETWLVQRDVCMAGIEVNVGKWDDSKTGMAIPSRSHEQWCSNNTFQSLKKLMDKIQVAELDELDSIMDETDL